MMKARRKNLTASEIFENRRKFPRLKMNLPVTITGPDNKKYKGILDDISPDGVRVKLLSGTGLGSLPDIDSPLEKIKSRKCILLFNLAYNQDIYRVRLIAYPVYLEKINDDTMISGMLFSEDDLTENKKVSDFLFYQLALSFIEAGYQPELKASDSASGKADEKGKHKEELSVQKQVLKDIPVELKELVLNVEHSKTELEPLKILLIRILSSLQTIQETARHIDEKVRMLEHKISRKD